MMERRRSRQEQVTERQEEEKRRKLNVEHPASPEVLVDPMMKNQTQKTNVLLMNGMKSACKKRTPVTRT